MTATSRQQQQQLWNGVGGEAWVQSQALLDQMFRPIEQRLTEHVLAEPAREVLDVGCGTGATTLAVAERLGEPARCVGVDVSGPMVQAAQARAAQSGMNVEFIHADAQTHPFEDGLRDVIFSRFGVMFFADPVTAFSNLRHGVKIGGRLHFVCWRRPEDNPFMTAAERAAVSWLPELPPRDPTMPGQFGLSQPERIRAILGASGWSDISVQADDASCVFPETELTHYLARMGPVGRALQTVGTARREQIIDAIRPAFSPFVDGALVRFTAACWWVSARNDGESWRS